MRRVNVRVLMLLVLAACWLTVGVRGADVEAAAGLTGEASTASSPQPTSERKGRIKAPDGQDRVHALEAVAASTDEAVDASTTVGATTALTASTAVSEATTPDRNVVSVGGLGPVAVLVTGCVVIAAVAFAFQKRRAARKNERDVSDPMQQSLLFHDMDYAAM